VPAVVGNTAAWALYFPCYAAAKARLGEGGAGVHMLAAAQAAVVVALATNPVWVAKTRLQLQRRERGSGGGPPRYTGLAQCLWRGAAEEGPRGLYAGRSASLALASYGALQFAAYEALRARARAAPAPGGAAGSGALSGPSAAACAALAKLSASCVTYPMQVLRSRLQQAGSDAALGGARGLAGLPALLRTEGPGALYRGFVPHLLRVLPNASLTLLVYEKVRERLVF